MKDVKKTLEYILQGIIPESDQVSIEENQMGDITVFEISSPEEVTGKIIGKEGKIIKSIRTILNLSYPQQRFLLKIKD